MIKECPNCGANVSPKAHACPQCGYQLIQESQEPITRQEIKPKPKSYYKKNYRNYHRNDGIKFMDIIAILFVVFAALSAIYSIGTSKGAIKPINQISQLQEKMQNIPNAVQESDAQIQEPAQNPEQDNVQDPVQENVQQDTNSPIRAEFKGSVLEYLSYEISTDYHDKPAIVLHFNFTNGSDKSASAQTIFYPKVFQNGIECEFAILNFDADIPAKDNSSKDIQKGATLEVAFPYTLSDTANPVDLEVKGLFDFDDKIYKQTINIQ